ncbi:MAG: uroporphyrinogen-III C-methyltransferase [Desulfocapsa sp.]|uniref:uroporphyrinogen-III C-methyltransferase n=1 Tax=Desulfotalea psychrophila TaxID=84980 RepID=A0ABS3AUH1_9BACT|nr:uroporphyrinogen-III C-methyltransferase [Desulfocapsa sp.]MBN4045908.1 uroporphyrinogen-III C-methyltransferase [bacterium AH-315-P11]MBN4058660.1 uroporphyrinogen-III C-methyltransferase [Desulfocapsa sp. AH-315-J15]MBN4060208.1 uroporphyrinogen-III C-methyltransferase [Desulfotalea psychrophila]MBN4068292.1 uroporphyrinogen-III C-methyltransferase [Desulfotalea psychrophila]
MSKIRKGKVYLVGAGPGDPGLITVRGKYILERAQVVVYDYLANPKLLKYVPKEAKLIYAGKKGGVKHTHTQEEINQMLVDWAETGKTVVRLKGGDPFIFGRGGEEVEVLSDSGVDFEVVPGVTSATAAATYAGIPITHRDYTASVAFLTGHEDPTKPGSNINWAKLATGAGTLVVYMGIKNLPLIVKNLVDHGRAPQTPVAVVRWASTPEQRSVVGTLDTIVDIVREAGIKPPALIIVGEVVNLRKKIDWFEKRPLFGKRIVVTRTREQASELMAGLEENGGNCIEYSTIKIEPVDSYEVLDEELERLEEYHWILFTSLNGVKYFFERLYARGMDARSMKGPCVAAVGKATADLLLEYGVRADLLPDVFTGEGLAESLLDQGVQGRNVLIPRAEKAREILPETLRGAGAQVTVAPVYKNVAPVGKREQLREELESGKVDMVTFTSSSTVRNFLSMVDAENDSDLKRLMHEVTIAAIGPITAKTVTDTGLTVDIQPETYTIPDMVYAIVDYYSK